jgi:hypothetical protein
MVPYQLGWQALMLSDTKLIDLRQELRNRGGLWTRD